MFDLRWDSSYDLSNHSADGRFRFSLRYVGAATDDPTVKNLIGDLSVDPDIPDARATWHRNYTPLAPWIRAHVLKQAMGWNGETQLADHFKEHPELAVAYGFVSDDPTTQSETVRPNLPAQSRLWEMWHEGFDDNLRTICRTVASELVELAREEGIPAPDDVFQPGGKGNTSKRSETRLITDTTKEVWQQTKPFVTEEFFLKRGSNAQIHENAFWEQHAFMGVRKNMFAESGADSFYVDSTRDRTLSGSTHRWQIRKLTIEEMRRQHRRTTKRLIERARRDGELVGELWTAIDVTKGAPFTGEMDTDDGGNVIEPYILGHRDGNYYHQWASIQIVGHDIPLVLDALPRKRGMAKDEIVAELLDHATEMVDDIDLVMMDREFDSDPVKDSCEEHGVYFLNPKRKFTDQNDTIEEMKRNEETVRIVEQPREDHPNRKNLFLPSTRETPEDEETKNEEGDDDPDERPNHRQEMRGELGLAEDDIDGDASPLGRLLGEIRGDEPLETEDANGDGTGFVVFQTNHPFVSARDEDGSPYDEREQIHMIARVIRWYRHRWGIENGYKKIKTFMVRTTSTCPRYRFFNFMFACVLYNVWRLVDLLVKLSLEMNPDYSPRVNANQFVTIAKQYYGLDPPD
ncbi:transposase [Natrialba asiatica]|uniref:Transposase IS4 family protein n=1 Tax=Natrialba asiatica (strain ATCC 700177 / DSM 12278 / JCM 9576 / FERM P-10747 / NBRC 102637 / 172P1) TaxID=29540 RepID=M0B781_NATA1|nr:transposase [Natrialba asiatica]ELZ06118.1 transposase IS4 family protein [Natrialba asiatica DSM 12278]